MLLHAAAAALMALATAQTEGGSGAPDKDRGADAIALPLVNYNSDQGWGAGLAGGAYLYAPGYKPYRHAIGFQTFFSTRGVQNHFVRYDGPHLLGPVRLEGRLEYRREFRSPFFGPGNLSAPQFDGDLDDRQFNYERVSPALWLRGRYRPLGRDHPMELHAGYTYRRTFVRAFQGSLLVEQAPPGVEGGPVGQVSAGVLWDTRDEEADPSRGGLDEVSVRLSSKVLLSEYDFAGVTLSGRRFVPLGPRLVLAQRLILDWVTGEVPFFEWTNIGGVGFTEGVGGLSSVRGVPRNRFAGDVKVISNTELRARLWSVPVLGQPIRVGAVAFLDAGRVWHRGVDDGPWLAWHPGAGFGLRFARRAAVVRGDVGWDLETGRRAAYLTFGHVF